MKHFSLIAALCLFSSIANAQFGCRATLACNYDPSAVLGDATYCDWSCYGCTLEEACNYAPEATELYGFIFGNPVVSEIESLFGLTELEAEALVAAQGVEECLVPIEAVGFDCTCSAYYEETYLSSDAYLGTGGGLVTLIPEVCGDHTYAGHGTGSAFIDVSYPCDVPNGYYRGSTGSATVNITAPLTMTSLTVFQSNGSVTYNIFYDPAATSVTTDSNSELVTFNLIPSTIDACPTCHAPSACNYDASGPLAGPEVCDWSCFGCDDAAGCNYNPLSSSTFDLFTSLAINSELQTAYGLTSFEASAYMATVPYLTGCIYPDPLFNNDCACTLAFAETFNASDAYFPNGSGVHIIVPEVCGGVAFAGHGTGSATLEVTYPCDVSSGFYAGGTGDNTVNLYIPWSMTSFHVENNTGSSIYNVYYNSTTTTVTTDIGGSAVANLIPLGTDPCATCHHPSACNYNPLGADTDPDVCDFSCFGCTNPTSCTYDPLATESYDPPTFGQFYSEFQTVYGMSFSEAVAYEGSLNLFPCLDPNPDFDNDCGCTVEFTYSFTDSDAFYSTGSDATLIPEVCNDVAYAGHNTGNATLEVVYPCGVSQGFYTGGTGTMVINLHIPPSMENFTASQNTGTVTYNIYYDPSFTTVTTENSIGSVTFNLLEPTMVLCNPGCTDPLACNYDPTSEFDNHTCSYSDGCNDPLAVNFVPGSACSRGCLYLNACGTLENTSENLATGFIGDYAESNWTVATNGGDGTVTFTEQQLVIEGNNDGQDAIDTDAVLIVPITGYHLFNWQYTTSDAAEYDPAFMLNGVWTALTDGGPSTDDASGSFALFLEAGDELGFRVQSTDGCCGPGVVTVAAFTHPGASDCVPGCTDAVACNYNPDATFEDGSCSFVDCSGCTYPNASNYDASAQVDNGSCTFPDGDCAGDLNGDGQVGTSDLLDLLGVFGTTCP